MAAFQLRSRTEFAGAHCVKGCFMHWIHDFVSKLLWWARYVVGLPPATARGYFGAFLFASVEVDALSWNLRHVTMRSGVGGCVNVPGTCVLKMMLRYRTLSGKSVTPATPNEFYSALKRLLKTTWLPNAQKKRFFWVLECVKTRKSCGPNDMYVSPLRIQRIDDIQKNE